MAQWILLIYKIPPAPAKHRIGVWRKLKKLGALYLQKSVILLPDNAYLRDELENLAHDIENFHGEATIIFTGSIEKEEKIVTEFQTHAIKEYGKIIANAEKFLKIISTGEKKTKIKEFMVMLDELKQKLTEARHIDYFDVEKRREAEKAVHECEDQNLKLLRET